MKKALKVVGVVFLTIFAAVAIFYVGWMRPPSGADVCDNVARIMKKEAHVEMGAKDREACIRSAETKPQFGLIPWVKRLKCMRDAQTSTELAACEGPASL
jgi:hypothetical protein